MSPVSADNAHLTQEVDRFRSAHLKYQTLLRGAAAEILDGLNSGSKSFGSVGAILDKLEREFIEEQRERLLNTLGNAAASALERAESMTGTESAPDSLTLSEKLHSAFAGDVEYAIRKVAKADAKAVQDFLEVQMMADRFMATSRELMVDIIFTTRDKAGRSIESEDLLHREINYATRGLYNGILAHSAVTAGIDKLVVDGGSKAGTEVSSDIIGTGMAMVYFHHNSKSLLQPID